MDMHSLGVLLRHLLANLLSKFVTETRLVIRDSNNKGYVKVQISAPYKIESANVAPDGNINVAVGISSGGEES